MRNLLFAVCVAAVAAAALAEEPVKAKFITALTPDGSPVARFRKAFVVKEVPATAPLEITSLGCFRAYLNGKPVGGDFLAPGFTQSDTRRLTLTYECAPLLQPGTNVIAVEVSRSWWSDAITRGSFAAFGGARGVRCKLLDVETDATWQAKFGGPVQMCGIYEGETFDARKDDRAWMTDPVSNWPNAAVVEGKILLTPDVGSVPRVRDDLELKPVAMRLLGGDVVGAATDRYGTAVVKEEGVKASVTVRPGETLVVDFGQNHAGVPSFVVDGPRGAELTVKFVEMLNDEGGLRSRGCDGPGGTPYITSLRGITAHARYVSDGTRRAYRPENTFFGYRYAAFTVTDPMTLSDIRAHVVTSVRRDTGRIVTGDARVNRLIANCVWGMYSNYLSIPTDCPQRNERLGWTGDTQVFSRTACYAADARGFLSKWLDDLCDFQREDGAYPDLAPIGSWDRKYCWYGITGWADAGVIVPYNLWQMYGDTDVVRRHWKSMCRYADFLEKNRGPADCFGDWLAFERNDADLKRIMSASYWVWDMAMMREMAAALGETADAERFAALEQTARENYAANYLDANGEIKAKYRSQTADLLALKLKLPPNEKAFAATKADLLANLRGHGNRLQTGFLGTSVLMDTLSDIGEREMAVTLLLQRENPSWLYSVDQGATTIWERWDSWTKEKGFGSAGMNSFNHYSYGAVLGWMYAHLAGIRPDPAQPGFRHFILAPEPDARLGSCEATYESVAGTIRSKWEYVDGKAKFTFEVPAGTTATAVLPDGRTFELKPGLATFAEVKPWFMNVVPTWGDDEIPFVADEMIRQKETVGLDTFIPSLSFHPRTTPAKALIPTLCARYRKLKERVAGKGITLGVLVQSLLGHGWNGKVPLTDETWQHVVLADGSESPRFCSLDPDFRSYTAAAIRALAAEKPAFILLDDDVGIRKGECFCPLHLARINAVLGKNYTREELQKVYAERPVDDPEVVAANRALEATIVEYGRDVVRKAIDEVDPTIRCGVCACWPGYWQMNGLVHALAGKTKPFMRVNNAVYGDSQAKDIVHSFQGGRAVMYQVDDDVEMIDEADTFPHNVMSESGVMFHAHLTTALLNGLVGAKLWTSEFQEPKALGTQARYEARLRDYAGFYAKLRTMAADGIEWKGACRPLVRPPAGYGGHPTRMEEGIYPTGWNSPLEAVCALPQRRDGVERGGIVALREEDVRRLGDEQLRRVLSGRALVDSLAARALTDRGFAELLGVRAGKGGKDFHFTSEWAADGSHSNSFMWDETTSELKLLDAAAEVTWSFCQGARFPRPQPFAPSVVRYRNKLGGRVVTLGWCLDLVYHKVLRPVRKLEVLGELDWLNGAPLEMAGLNGDQALVRHGVTKSGEEFVAYVSLSYDILPELELRLVRKVKSVERLSPRGVWEPVGFERRDAERIAVGVRVDPLEPIVLRIAAE